MMPTPTPTPTIDELYRSLHGDATAPADAVQEVAAAARASGLPVVVVSACLCGVHCRFDGGQRANTAVLRATQRKFVVPLCPEVLGGMSVPRPPVYFAAPDTIDTIVDEAGRDRSAQLAQGADRAFDLLQSLDAKQAILKERSPSCGVRQVHGPHGVQAGAGVFARRLQQAGVALFTEEDADELL
jgi:uncharacterized protein YbbK (DUF523 family)